MYPPAELQDRGIRAKLDKPFSYLGLLIVSILLNQTKLCAMRPDAEPLRGGCLGREKGM